MPRYPSRAPAAFRTPCITALCGLTLLSLALAGCKPPAAPAPGGAGSAAPARATIGVALSSMNHNFFIGMRQGVEDQLAAEGFKAEVVEANDSATDQQQQVDQLISRGVKAIVMVPVDAVQAATPVKAANQAGIPVF